MKALVCLELTHVLSVGGMAESDGVPLLWRLLQWLPELKREEADPDPCATCFFLLCICVVPLKGLLLVLMACWKDLVVDASSDE